ncbi:hypothetical protein D9O50_02030 [Oxalobacteraceae bacterium CAVE-383]|nr:hypothetical protein D9O50_02030 [Oxalobacteraceae bacterium CAVE-383]
MPSNVMRIAAPSLTRSASVPDLTKSGTLPGLLRRAHSLGGGLNLRQGRVQDGLSDALAAPVANPETAVPAGRAETPTPSAMMASLAGVRPENAATAPKTEAVEAERPGEPVDPDLGPLREIREIIGTDPLNREPDVAEADAPPDIGAPETTTGGGPDDDPPAPANSANSANLSNPADPAPANAPDAGAPAADVLANGQKLAARFNEEVVASLFAGHPRKDALIKSWKDTPSIIAKEKIVDFAAILKLSRDKIQASNLPASEKNAELAKLDVVAGKFVAMAAADGLRGKTVFGAYYAGGHQRAKKIKALETQLDTLSGGQTGEALRKQMLEKHVYPFVFEHMQRKFGGTLDIAASEIGDTMLDFQARKTLDEIVEAYCKAAARNDGSISAHAKSLRVLTVIPDLLRGMLEEQSADALPPAPPATPAATPPADPASTPPSAATATPASIPGLPPGSVFNGPVYFGPVDNSVNIADSFNSESTSVAGGEEVGGEDLDGEGLVNEVAVEGSPSRAAASIASDVGDVYDVEEDEDDGLDPDDPAGLNRLAARLKALTGGVDEVDIGIKRMPTSETIPSALGASKAVLSESQSGELPALTELVLPREKTPEPDGDQYIAKETDTVDALPQAKTPSKIGDLIARFNQDGGEAWLPRDGKLYGRYLGRNGDVPKRLLTTWNLSHEDRNTGTPQPEHPEYFRPLTENEKATAKLAREGTPADVEQSAA